MHKAAIGVVQKDGRILMARVKGGHEIGGVLQRSYATPLQATMLVSLGEIETLGATPRDCRLPTNPEEPQLVTPSIFEQMAGEQTSSFHLYDAGKWTSWSELADTFAGFMIEID